MGLCFGVVDSNFACSGEIAHHLVFLLLIILESPCPQGLSTGSFICAVSVELKGSSSF